MTKLMQLEEASYKNGLYTLVSDPSLVGSARRTKRLAIDNIPATARTWDITPIVNPPTTPDLEIIDTFQLNVGSQNELSIDPTSPLITVGGQPMYKHGCAKTNINLAMLNDGDTWHVGLRAIVTGGYTFSRVVFYDTNVDAAEYAAYSLHQLTDPGAAPSNQFGLSIIRSAANLSIAGTMYNPVTQSYHQIGGEFPMKYDVDTNGSDNTTVLMLLHRDGNTLNVTIAAVDTSGNYDISEVHSVGNDNFPFDFSSLTMFLYLGTVASPSMVYQSVAPTITTGLPDYDVAFTKYETVYSGTQSTFDELFPVEAHRPSGVLVQQAVFPEGVRVGELLNVRVDLQYAGAPPRPYGLSLAHGKTYMVTANSSEGVGLERIIRSSEYDPLVQTVNGLSTGTDRSRGFMLYKAQYGNVIAVDDTETDYIVNLNELETGADVSKKYGFLSEAGGAQTYLLNEHKLYEIRLKCNIATSPGLTFEVKIKRIDDPFDEEHLSDFVTAVTDNSGQAWVDATYYRTMVGGGTYALTVRNVTQPTNFSLMDIVLTIREF